jgi:RNA polymerase sigma factor (TIGR02999 family)
VSKAASITDLIVSMQGGERTALHALFEFAYGDLTRLARARLRACSRGTLLDTTSLVHESYLRFAQAHDVRIQNRKHFLRYAGQVMRCVIVDIVRQRMTERRGGDLKKTTLNTDAGATRDAQGEREILQVHEALEELSKLDVRLGQVVEMRYFGGMTDSEIAEALGITDRTVRRDWEKARVLLAHALR